MPVRTENIDTDQIIPARFLKATERKGFGDNLFRDWRYDAEGRKVASFPLNDSRYGDRKSTRLNSSHPPESRMPSSA